MKCNQIIDILEELSPAKYACDWDNIGLMVGRRESEINRILVALEADDAAVDKAIQCQADMIVTHHPFIFGKISSITDDTLTGRRALKMIEQGISCYSMHTNFDVKGGMAQLAAERIGIENCEVLEVICDNEGLGRVGTYKSDMTVHDWANRVKDVFGLPNVSVFGDMDMKVNRVAIAPGAGKDAVSYAIDKGAQVLITGDIGHHTGIDANALGMAIIDAGHYGIEHIFIGFVCEYLQKNTNVEVVKMDKRLPFSVI